MAEYTPQTMHREFRGVWIPKEVWFDSRLSALDKVILAEIDSLDNEDSCYATNDYLAKFCQCSVTKVSTSISKLIEYGYVEVLRFDGRHRFLGSRLSKSERQPTSISENESQPFKNCKADFQKVKANNIEYIINDSSDYKEKENDPYNPFGEGRRPDRNTVYAYASNELVSLSQRAMQEIGDYVNDLSEDVVRHAIDNALDQGVRTWAYVKTILNGYVDAEVHSVGDAKRVDEEYSKKRKGGAKQENADKSTDKKWQDMTPEEQEYALNHGPFGPWVR